MRLYFHADGTDQWHWDLPRDHATQPRLLRLSACLAEGDKLDHAMCNLVRQPPDMLISADALKYHGVQLEAAQKTGREIQDVVAEFERMLRRAHAIVAFNLQFHRRMLDRAAAQVGTELKWPALTRCAMQDSADLVQVRKGRNGRWVWPSMAAAYKHFTLKDLPASDDPIEGGVALAEAVAVIDQGISTVKGPPIYRPAAA